MFDIDCLKGVIAFGAALGVAFVAGKTRIFWREYAQILSAVVDGCAGSGASAEEMEDRVPPPRRWGETGATTPVTAQALKIFACAGLKSSEATEALLSR